MEFSSVYLFTSWEFLAFFILALTGYFLVPKAVACIGKAGALKKFEWLQNTQWIWLLLSGSVFYVSYYVFLSDKYKYGTSAYLFICCLLVSIISIYVLARFIAGRNEYQKAHLKEHKADYTKEDKKKFKDKVKRQKQFLVAICCLINVGILCVLKYTGFFVDIANSAGASLTTPDWIVLPLGISFYTFQAIGYVVDVNRGVCDAQKNPFKLALFVSYFPQMFQGPIGRYDKLAPQLYSAHKFDYDAFRNGAVRMMWGFFKKLVIADRITKFIDPVFADYNAYSGGVIAVAVILYAVQLYADFSGYMDIALGASQCMGISLTENFERPFFSKSVAEFWRRWHISLGDWFRDYVFYSILRSKWCSNLVKKVGNKNGFAKYVSKNIGTIIGLSVVWLIMGFWHGDAWHYVFMGVFFGAVIILSTLLSKPFKWTSEKFRGAFFDVLRIVRTGLIIAFGFIFFRADSLSTAFGMIGKMFTFANGEFASVLTPGFNTFQWGISVVSILALFGVSLYQENKGPVRQKLFGSNIVLRYAAVLLLLLVVFMLGIYGGAGGSFAYFDF